jgi:dipeptidyl aminopeptidase/acylaminoacyl peptidase
MPGRHPAIVFLHGSGPEGRWANRYLANRFAEQGFVALVYDKRGVGQSTGDWKSAGFDGLADDGATAIKFLASLPEVDHRRIGLYGHSQGGTIAPLVATRAKQAAFVIASAAAGLDPAVVELYSVGNSMNLQGLTGSEHADALTYLHALVDVAYGGANRQALDALALKFKSRDWYVDPPPADNYYWSFSKRIAGFRPAKYWARVKVPVLLVYGARDERVPPGESAAAIQSSLLAGGNDNVTVKTYPRADHTFVIIEPAPQGGWPKHVPGYADYLINWASGRR